MRKTFREDISVVEQLNVLRFRFAGLSPAFYCTNSKICTSYKWDINQIFSVP